MTTEPWAAHGGTRSSSPKRERTSRQRPGSVLAYSRVYATNARLSPDWNSECRRLLGSRHARLAQPRRRREQQRRRGGFQRHARSRRERWRGRRERIGDDGHRWRDGRRRFGERFQRSGDGPNPTRTDVAPRGRRRGHRTPSLRLELRGLAGWRRKRRRSKQFWRRRPTQRIELWSGNELGKQFGVNSEGAGLFGPPDSGHRQAMSRRQGRSGHLRRRERRVHARVPLPARSRGRRGRSAAFPAPLRSRRGRMQSGRRLRGWRRQRLHELVHVHRERAFPLHDGVRASAPAPPAPFSAGMRDSERRRLHRRGSAHGLFPRRGLFAERGVRIGRSSGDLQHDVRLRPVGPLPMYDDVS